MSYIYCVVLSLWSAYYVESWKRVENILEFVWGLDEQSEQITKAVERKRVGSIKVVNKVTGKIENIVLEDRSFRNFFETLMLLVVFALIAYGIWFFLLQICKK